MKKHTEKISFRGDFRVYKSAENAGNLRVVLL